MKIILKDYQLNAITKSISRLQAGEQTMLAFDMGLGKTFTALGIAREMIQTQSNIKVSICAPASLLPNWRESARLFDIPIYTSSYDARIPPIITKDTLVILDECHYLKNRDSNRWKRL